MFRYFDILLIERMNEPRNFWCIFQYSFYDFVQLLHQKQIHYSLHIQLCIFNHSPAVSFSKYVVIGDITNDRHDYNYYLWGLLHTLVTHKAIQIGF